MEPIIVYVDDAEHALPQLRTLAAAHASAQTHWVLLACAPRITHRVSRFVSNRTREQWRGKWADKLLERCLPVLEDSGATVTALLARGPLPEMVAAVTEQHGVPREIIDLRRPKSEPSAANTPSPASQLWTPWTSAITGLGAVWTMWCAECLSA